MYVKDHYRWAQAKKKASGTLLFVGIFLSFGMEGGSLWWGIIGLIVAFTGIGIFQTIDHHYL